MFTQTLTHTPTALAEMVASGVKMIYVDTSAMPELMALVSLDDVAMLAGPSGGQSAELVQALMQAGASRWTAYWALRRLGPELVATLVRQYRFTATDLDILTLSLKASA